MLQLDRDLMLMLIAVVDDVRGQGDRCLSYARDEVCRPDGFRTSDASLLAPLGDLLASIAEQADQLRKDIDVWWDELDHALRTTLASCADRDAAQAVRWPTLGAA